MSNVVTKDTKVEDVKEMKIWRLPPQSVSIASRDRYGAKSFTIEDLKSAIKNGLTLQDQPICPI